MKRCSVCNGVTLWSTLRSNGDIFCSTYCMTYSTMPGFCSRCALETTGDTLGSTHMSTFGGSMLLGASSRCSTCHSIVQRHVYFALLFPIWWKARYRVIYTTRTAYVGRSLKNP
jgi:hypothetical protein